MRPRTYCAVVGVFALMQADVQVQRASGSNHVRFQSVREVESTIDRITAASGLAANFAIVAQEGYGNAASTIVDGRRIIIYDPQFLLDLEQRIGSAWAPISVIAHEVAHHLNGHTVGQIDRQHRAELEADFFSGFILKRMGAGLADALAAVRLLVPEQASPSHPGRDARVAEITRGWNAAEENGIRADQALEDALEEVARVGDQAGRALAEAELASAQAAETRQLVLVLAVVLVPIVLVVLVLAWRRPRGEVARMMERVSAGVRRWGGGAESDGSRHRVAPASTGNGASGAPVLAFAVAGRSGPPHEVLVRDTGLDGAAGGFVIGRHPPLVDDIVADPTISQRHARVTRDGRRFYIEDLNSSNGTRVNGARLEPFEPQEIAPGDDIQLGDMTMSVRPIRARPSFA